MGRRVVKAPLGTAGFRVMLTRILLDLLRTLLDCYIVERQALLKVFSQVADVSLEFSGLLSICWQLHVLEPRDSLTFAWRFRKLYSQVPLGLNWLRIQILLLEEVRVDVDLSFSNGL